MDKNRDRKLIVSFKVPVYVREIQLSKAQREKYYEWNGVTIKCKSKKLLQKYICQSINNKKHIIRNKGNVQPINLKKEYCIVGFKGKYVASVIDNTGVEQFFVLTESQHKKPIKYILCSIDNNSPTNEKFKKVIANETQAGKPKVQIINGQSIYNHTASPFTTGKIFDTIKEMYYQKFIDIPILQREALRTVLQSSYPLQIEMEIQDTVKNFYDNSKTGNGKIWDVGNRADPYMKTFLDFFVKGLKDIYGFIEDDDRLHVTTGNNAIFTPIDNVENRALIFHVYKDTREVFKQYLNEN